MKKKVPFIIVLLLSLTHTLSFAQFEFGGNPRGQDWHMMSSQSVRVIYPLGMETQAQRISSIIHHMDLHNRRSIGDKKWRFDMVLQNRTVNPNGYVAFAPLRSEFYSTPPQSNLLLGSMDWLDILTIHEYRHVQQLQNSTRGLSKLLYVFLGELGWAFAQNLSIPNWFTEGDAVIMETALSSSGRGRAPFFTKEQRALASADLNYKYLKHRNGSFKSLLPNHYRLGYMILTHTRDKYGNDITGKIHNGAAGYWGVFYPFSANMKRYTGKRVRSIYHDAWEESKTQWKEQLSSTTLIPTHYITPKHPKIVTNYRYPRVLDDGTLIAMKYSFDKTEALVAIQGDGSAKDLTSIGISNDDFITYGGGKVCWIENHIHPRRGNMDYSDIMVYDIRTDSKKQLTDKKRFFSPAPNHKGDAIAAIHIDYNQENQISILNPRSGQVVKSLPNPSNYFLSRLAWTDDDLSLITIAKHEGQLALFLVDVETGEMSQLTPWSSHTIEAPSIHGDKVYFNAGYSGIDNIFATDLRGSQSIYQVTSVPIGAYEPEVSMDGKTLYFTEFTEMGYVLSSQDLSASSRFTTPIAIMPAADMPQYKTTANATEGGDILQSVAAVDVATRKYDNVLLGQKLHSWTLIPSTATPGLTIMSTNLLNDLKFEVGGLLNRNEDNAYTYTAKVDFARYFPVFSLEAIRSERNTEFLTSSGTIGEQAYNETQLGGEISVPLQSQNGNYYSSLRPYIGAHYRLLSDVNIENIPTSIEPLTTMTVGVDLSSLRRRALQNVDVRAGLELKSFINTSLSGGASTRIYNKASFYLPGLSNNHAVKITASYQKELLSNFYQYDDIFEYARGYSAPANDEAFGYTITYKLPLFYPDFGIAGLTYFKRIRANLFFDGGWYKTAINRNNKNLNSAGLELVFDNTLLNIAANLSFGFRNSYLLNRDPNDIDRKSNFEFVTYLGI